MRKKGLQGSPVKTVTKDINYKKGSITGEKNFFEQLFEFSADGILLTDVDGYITDVNKSVEEMLGYTQQKLQGRHSSELIPPELENRDFAKQTIEQLKNNKKQTSTLECRWVRQDGKPVFVELSTALLKNDNGDIIGTINNVRDVSLRVEVEEELKKRNRELLIFNTIISFISQFLNIGELLDSALEKVLEIMKIESGALLLLDEERNNFSLEASKGFSPDFAEKISSIDAEEDIIGETVRSGNDFLLEDNEQSEVSFSECMFTEDISSLFFLPIKTNKKVYGMMVFGRRHSRFFSEIDTRLLGNISYQIALSIENALLYQRVKDSEEKYRHLTESANIGIISFTREGKIIQFNKKAEEIFGFSKEEIINNLAIKILPEKSNQIFEKIASLYMTSGEKTTLGHTIMEYGKGKYDKQIPLDISYSIWGDKLNPIITATIKDMR